MWEFFLEEMLLLDKSASPYREWGVTTKVKPEVT